jgi:hypothetical protein
MFLFFSLDEPETEEASGRGPRVKRFGLSGSRDDRRHRSPLLREGRAAVILLALGATLLYSTKKDTTMNMFLHVLAKLAPCVPCSIRPPRERFQPSPSLLIDTTARFSLRG